MRSSDLFERLLETGQCQVELTLGDDQWRVELQHASQRSAGECQQPTACEVGDETLGSGGVDQLDAPHQSDATHADDGGEAVGPGFDATSDRSAESARTLRQTLGS